MALRDRPMELALALGGLVPGLAVAAAAPRLTGAAVVAAGAAFVLAFLLGEGTRARHHLTVLSALLLPGVVGAAALQQLGASDAIQQTYAGLVLIIVGVGLALAQGMLDLPALVGRRLSRCLALPWIVLLASCFRGVLDFAAGELASADATLGHAAVIVLGLLPGLFYFFTVGPATLVDEAPVGWPRWVARYAIALGAALLSALLTGSLQR